MTFPTLSVGALALALALGTAAAVEDSPKKSAGKKPGGGFTGGTPKPSTDGAPAKKKFIGATDESAPAKKKAVPDEAPAPLKKKAVAAEDNAPAKTKPGADDDGETPAKKRRPQLDGEAGGSKKADPETKEKTTASEQSSAAAEEPAGTPAPERAIRAPAATLTPAELTEFASQPPRVQQLISSALELTQRNLTYTYGSDDPARGGMDCSGTMAYVLRAQGFADVPRDSSSQYIWARKKAEFFAVVGKSAESFEFKDLRPGDLMFWTGTYETGREMPISHVMLYLGREKKSGNRVMFGASDGRSYNGVQRWGVSVFDFKMPRTDPANPEKAKVDFVGYARIPGLAAESPTAEPVATTPESKPTEPAAAEEDAASKAKPEPTPRKKTPPKTKKKVARDP